MAKNREYDQLLTLKKAYDHVAVALLQFGDNQLFGDRRPEIRGMGSQVTAVLPIHVLAPHCLSLSSL
jgi:hypothetical protein